MAAAVIVAPSLEDAGGHGVEAIPLSPHRTQFFGRKKMLFALRAAACGSLGGLLMGYDLGAMTDALPDVTAFFQLSTVEAETVTSMMLIGCVVGASFGGWLSDYMGRKLTVYATAAVFVFSAIVTALCYQVSGLLVGRFLVGVGVAVSAIVDVTYLNEISPPEWRGMVVSCNELFVTVGVLLAFLMGWLVAPLPKGWRLLFGFPIVISMCWLSAMFNLPESPKWLLATGRSDDALRVYRTIEGGNEAAAQKEHAAAAASLAAARDGSAALPTLRDMLCRTWAPQVAVSITLMLSQQFVGHSALLTYAPSVLDSLGLSPDGAAAVVVVLGCVKVVFTLAALAVVDLVGRKSLLLCGAVGMMGCYVVLASALSGPPSSSNTTLAVVAMNGVVACYALGFGPVTWLIVSELFPDDCRGRAIGVASVANWLANALVVGTFLSVVQQYGTASTFSIYACVCGAAALFVHLVVPETRLKDVSDLRRELQARLHRLHPTRLWRSCCFGRYANIDSNGGGQAVGVRRRSGSELSDGGDAVSVASFGYAPHLLLSVVPSSSQPTGRTTL